jgi:glyoxylase-like metal-dependent hydrolase (beta-lactamase superfamily II)
MGLQQNQLLSRRHFCLCCVTGAAFAATGDWLNPRQAFAEARGMIAASDANLAVATDNTIIIPGHGKPVSNKSELKAFRDMLADIRDKVAALKKAGRTLPETVDAKPTADHDGKWGQFVIDPAFFTKLVYEGV